MAPPSRPRNDEAPTDYIQCPTPGCGVFLHFNKYDEHVAHCAAISSSSDDESDVAINVGNDDGAGSDDAIAGSDDGARSDDARSQEGSGDSGDEGEAGQAAADAAHADPGLLSAEERRRRLTKWVLLQPELDPRIRFGDWDWEQMETVVDAHMSVDVAHAHLARLHRRGCDRLGLTLRTRNDVSRKLRSLLDLHPASVACEGDVADGRPLPLHFFEETVSWTGETGEPESCHVVMRELIPVVLASYLDPHAYGRQRTCYYAPTVGGAGTERIYAGPLTSECFRRAQESVPGKQAVSIDGFYDETVIESNGKRYKPCATATLQPLGAVASASARPSLPHPQQRQRMPSSPLVRRRAGTSLSATT